MILLVEDNIDDEVLALRALRKNKVSDEVIVVRDGQEALDFLFCQEPVHPQPRLILLDLNLPRVSGLEVLRQLRANASTRLLPVVVLTTSDEDRDRLESYDLGANSYVKKPIDYRDFTEMMKLLSDFWLNTNLPPPAGGLS